MSIQASTRSVERLAEKVDAIAASARELQAMLARRTGHELLADLAARIDEMDGSFFEVTYALRVEEPRWRALIYLGTKWTHPEATPYPVTIERVGSDVADVAVAALAMLEDVTPLEVSA